MCLSVGLAGQIVDDSSLQIDVNLEAGSDSNCDVTEGRATQLPRPTTIAERRYNSEANRRAPSPNVDRQTVCLGNPSSQSGKSDSYQSLNCWIVDLS